MDGFVNCLRRNRARVDMCGVQEMRKAATIAISLNNRYRQHEFGDDMASRHFFAEGDHSYAKTSKENT